jgi:hypothetical protein
MAPTVLSKAPLHNGGVHTHQGIAGRHHKNQRQDDKCSKIFRIHICDIFLTLHLGRFYGFLRNEVEFMKKYSIGWALLCCSFLFCMGAHAGEDKVIRLSKNGKLLGLPHEFQPARFDKKNMAVSIGKRSLQFPRCLKSYLPAKDFELSIGGAWYQSATDMPPYIHFVYSFTKSSSDPGTEIWLVFSLDTLEMLSAEIAAIGENGWTHRDLKLDFSCQRSIASAVTLK